MNQHLVPVDMVLLVGAAIVFGLGAAQVQARVNWIALGLLLWVLTVLI